ncbi:MAG: YggS family pyridoxal phosphate-dependent enzyme [Sphingobacteriia bacterium]|nr:MAG: YggS family pyridoxal phosphate-dependent enzyme [Sphingobacteriia bacterium]TAG32162.1 MAG: YggS family pyridoxal phosphate-dependent enzyme [Sphingobacteriia bacterium]TAH09309.1 MAG: YggS family pyridoxal phosphate-dependent enzyme [Sphingobacteriia bacterium]
MPVNTAVYQSIKKELSLTNTRLIAVSKTKPLGDLQEMYDLGQRDFGENYVQELVDKQAALPKDINWHFIGHLQSNKVKYIAPFVHLIHGVDGLKLLQEINKQAAKNNRVIDCLLQIHIAQEETKFGLNEKELTELQPYIDQLKNVRICGLMGMASFTEDQLQLESEFKSLKSIAEKFKSIFGSISTVHRLPSMILSMGMSSDYQLAIQNGSNMVRIGSLLFGARK